MLLSVASVLAITPGAEAETRSCSGSYKALKNRAIASFEKNCGRSFNPSKDKCKAKLFKGIKCWGDVETGTFTIIISPPTPENLVDAEIRAFRSGYCSNPGTFAKITDAKDAYARRCGQTWDQNSGRHKCAWFAKSSNPQGWVCRG